MKRFLLDVYWVFWREMKRFFRQKIRIVMSIIQPMIWLILMGNSLAGLTRNPFAAKILGTENYLTFMTPGIVVMTTLFSGVYGGMSILWDRRLGFFNKMLAAPIHRAAIPLGKLIWLMALGWIQMVVIMSAAMFMGVRIVTGIPGILALMAFASLFGVIMAGISLSLSARLKSMDTLFAITNFLTMPLMFTSNAMFPVQAMPKWMQAIAAVNPLSYAVGPMRIIATQGWLWGQIWGGFLALVLMALISISIAIIQFEHPET